MKVSFLVECISGSSGEGRKCLLSYLQYGFGRVFLSHNLFQAKEAFLRQLRFVLDKRSTFREEKVVFDDFLELGEVPGIPFTHSHGEGVDVLSSLGDSRVDLLDGTIMMHVNNKINPTNSSIVAEDGGVRRA